MLKTRTWRARKMLTAKLSTCLVLGVLGVTWADDLGGDLRRRIAAQMEASALIIEELAGPKQLVVQACITMTGASESDRSSGYTLLPRVRLLNGDVQLQIIVCRKSKVQENPSELLLLMIDNEVITVAVDKSITEPLRIPYTEDRSEFRITPKIADRIAASKECVIVASGQLGKRETTLTPFEKHQFAALRSIASDMHAAIEKNIDVYEECRDTKMRAEVKVAAKERIAKSKKERVALATQAMTQLDMAVEPARVIAGQNPDEWYKVTITNNSDYFVIMAKFAVMRGATSNTMTVKNIPVGKSSSKTVRINGKGAVRCEPLECEVRFRH